MSILAQTTPTALADKLVTVLTVNTIAKNNVTGSTSGIIYMIEVDNGNNELDDLYLKIADASSATVGTTQPKMCFRIPKQTKVVFAISNGFAYSAGISMWATKNPAYTDSTVPDSGLDVQLLATA